MRARLVFTVLVAWFAMPVVANTEAFSTAEEARYQALISQLRCLVCQNQTIAESNAPLAVDLRNQVQGMMRAGRNDDEIKHYLTQRYGDFVLYKPPLKTTTWVLWLGPFLLLAGALLVAVFVIRQSRKPNTKPEPGPDEINRILRDEDS
jgi:cytochrome c-type biogenesis protein CcmH